MDFYIDSANMEEIEKAVSLGYVRGITTNPTLLKRAEVWKNFKSLNEFYSKLMKMCDGKVFAQIPSQNHERTLNELENLDNSRLVIKVPSVPTGIKVANNIMSRGYSVCATAVYTTSQAAMWSSIGVDYVAIYVNRMEKRGFNAKENIASILNVLSNTRTKVLAASVKTVEQLSYLMDMGIEHITLGYEMLEAITKCDFSIDDVKVFDDDSEEVMKRFGKNENSGV